MKNNKIVSFRTTNSNKTLIEKISKARGEDASDFIRRAIFKELAELGFISKDKRKALGLVHSIREKINGGSEPENCH